MCCLHCPKWLVPAGQWRAMPSDARAAAKRSGGAESAGHGLCGRCYKRALRGLPPVPRDDSRGHVFSEPTQAAYTKAGLDAYIARRNQRLRRKADAAA